MLTPLLAVSASSAHTRTLARHNTLGLSSGNTRRTPVLGPAPLGGGPPELRRRGTRMTPSRSKQSTRGHARRGRLCQRENGANTRTSPGQNTLSLHGHHAGAARGRPLDQRSRQGLALTSAVARAAVPALTADSGT